MSDNEIKLKPCPFCGHTPMIDESKRQRMNIFRVKCSCGVNTGYYATIGLPVKVWNTRTK